MTDIVSWIVLVLAILVILYLWVGSILRLYFNMRHKHHLNMIKHLKKEEGKCQ